MLYKSLEASFLEFLTIFGCVLFLNQRDLRFDNFCSVLVKEILE